MSSQDRWSILRASQKRRGIGKKQSAREIVEMEVISWRNEREDYSSETYDCGKLGVLHLWLHHSWQREWFEPKPLPEGIQVR